MAFSLSPGVSVKEIDLTNVVPAVSTSIGALAGVFNAGPVNKVMSISSEGQLVSVFGQPTNENFISFFQAASFLKYGNNLKVVRVANGVLNATAQAGAGIAVLNEDLYDEEFADGQGEGTNGNWTAKAPGISGNGIKVEICTAGTSFATWQYKDQFDAEPETSSWVSARGGALDEMHVIVVDEGGFITGTPGTILEKFDFVSQASDSKKEDGSNNYYKNVVNSGSKYVYWTGLPSQLTALPGQEVGGPSTSTFVDAGQIISDPLTGGSDGSAVTAGDLQMGMDLFADADTLDVNLLISPVDATGQAVLAKYAVETIAEGRKDVVAMVSPPLAATVANADPVGDVLAFTNAINSSSYGFADSSAVKMYDKYNDVMRWVPANGLTAGLMANVDNVADAWFSPAGLNRGQLKGVSKLAMNPTKSQRDDLYKNRVNPLVSFPGEGTVLFGDKTLLSRPSAFDRINVRRLFIVLEKAIATASKYQLFEQNDQFTRSQFRSMVEPFMRNVKGRRGMTDFLVVCDETNNTPEVIDTNNFVADIYIKPTRSINFINLNFIATRTGVEFSELVG
jgi:phage tail sheath protein FI